MRRRKLVPEKTHSKVSLTLRFAFPRELGPRISGFQSIQSPLGLSARFYSFLFLFFSDRDHPFSIFICALQL